MAERPDLTRRKILGSLGAIGAGAAVAGMGTTAFFSDEENFDGNSLTAGALDLKIDWQEHYSDWSDDEEAAVSDIVMLGPGESVPTGYVGLPTAADPMIAIPEEDLGAFMEATALEAFPDYDDDGIQDDFREHFCVEGADTPEDLNPRESLRSQIDGETYGSGDPFPLVYLDDVKPGDFGEVTFSMHLCDNPGYLWVNGGIDWDLTGENGHTEPERKDPDETDGVVELLDELMVALWYDHGETVAWDGDAYEGDNVMQANETAMEFGNTIAVGSLRTVMNLLDTEDGLGVPLDGGLGNGFTEIEPVGSGTVGPGSADSIAKLVCESKGSSSDPYNPNCGDLGLLEALKLDEPDITTGDHVTPAGTVTVESFDVSAGTMTLSTNFPVSGVITKGGPAARVCRADGDGDGTPLEEGDGVGLNEVTFRTPTNPNTGHNYGLSHFTVCYEGAVNGHDGDGRDCFENSTTAYLGFAWWLPVDHANEIQTDSVGFDLGFYTEQCRHNDGSGMAPEDTNS